MTNPAIQNDFSYYRRTISRNRLNNQQVRLGDMIRLRLFMLHTWLNAQPNQHAASLSLQSLMTDGGVSFLLTTQRDVQSILFAIRVTHISAIIMLSAASPIGLCDWCVSLRHGIRFALARSWRRRTRLTMKWPIGCRCSTLKQHPCWRLWVTPPPSLFQR